METNLILPYPPSINTYRSVVNGRLLLSKKGREYKNAVGKICMIQKTKKHTGKVKMTVVAYPPDKRQRDIDNICKALLDALEYAGVYDNDNQVVDLHVMKCDEMDIGITISGTVVVTVEDIEEGS